MSYQPRYKLFCISIVTTSPQNETQISKIVGFHLTKILQSEEFHLITFNLRKIRFSIQIQIPQIVGIRGIKNIQSGEFLLITYNLRNNQIGFHWTRILQSEEFFLITFNLRKIRFSVQI